MSLENIYDLSYASFTPEWLSDDLKVDAYLHQNSETLLSFYKSYSQQFQFPKSYQDLSVLDLGCGLGGVSNFFAKKGASVTGVDVSALAISFAKEISSRKGLSVSYVNHNVCERDLKLGEFDLIIDSHLLHCLTSSEDRRNYFEFVKRSLKDDGVYLLESLAYHPGIEVPVGYVLDESFTLYKSVNNTDVPIRKVMSSMELEQEVLEYLNIHYLYYHSELAFEIFSEYKNYPFELLPRTVRIAGKK